MRRDARRRPCAGVFAAVYARFFLFCISSTAAPARAAMPIHTSTGLSSPVRGASGYSGLAGVTGWSGVTVTVTSLMSYRLVFWASRR